MSCVVNIFDTIEKALKAIMLCAFLCVYRTWRGTHLAAMTYCSLASETAPMHHVAQKVDRWQRLTDENNLNVKTLKVIFHKATYLSLSNVKDQFYKSSSAKDTSYCTFYCSKRMFIFFFSFLSYQIFIFKDHLKARLLNSPFLAIVRHFLSLQDWWVCVFWETYYNIECVIYSEWKRQTVTPFKSFLSYLTARMDGSLGKHFFLHYFRETDPHD